MEKRQILKIILKIVKYVFFAFAAFVMVFTVISATSLNKDTGNGFFGYKLFIVLSDSMKPEFGAGDVAVCKKVDPSALFEGDIITFKSTDKSNFGEIVTHKIKSKTVHEGKDAFITYGINTGYEDEPALAEKVIGRYVFSLPGAGYLFGFLKSPAGYFSLIFIPFFFLILFEGIKFFGAVRQYKKEQQEEIDRQKAELELERQKNQAMMAEVETLLKSLEEKSKQPEEASSEG